MSLLPRPAAAPKLAPLQVELTAIDLIDAHQLDDDALLTELDALRLEAAGLDCEFVEWASVRVAQGSLAGSHWRRANWVDVECRQVDAANAAFVETGWKRTVWTGSRLTGVGLAGCTLQDVAFVDCKLDLANFRFSNLQRVCFTGCDLQGADFANAMARELLFSDCRLDGADFTQFKVERVLVDGGSLTGLKGLEDLRGAHIRSDQVFDLAREMAATLGLQLID